MDRRRQRSESDEEESRPRFRVRVHGYDTTVSSESHFREIIERALQESCLNAIERGASRGSRENSDTSYSSGYFSDHVFAKPRPNFNCPQLNVAHEQIKVESHPALEICFKTVGIEILSDTQAANLPVNGYLVTLMNRRYFLCLMAVVEMLRYHDPELYG